MKIIDLRGQLPTWNELRPKEPKKFFKLRNLIDITSIAVHHSLTFRGSAAAFARYHVEHNEWAGIGYTYVIEEEDGSVEWCWDWNVKTAHVGNSNKNALGICLVGDFRKENPKNFMLESAAELCKMLMFQIPTIKEIKPHQAYPGYSWKKCPGFDIKLLTDLL
jgi:hypothetical protein